jgi:tRNA(Arg) A34 adenosine deaminase TadA
MCYGAAHWAGIRKIYYGASWEDYSDFYDDSEAIKEMNLPPEQQAMAPEQLLRQQAIEVWRTVRQERGMAQPESA